MQKYDVIHDTLFWEVLTAKHYFVYHWEHKNVKLIARLGIFRHYCVFILEFFKQAVTKVFNNGNCTEWSAIWSEIKRVITKSHDREAGVRFVITSLISDQNCTTRSAISTLLHSF